MLKDYLYYSYLAIVLISIMANLLQFQRKEATEKILVLFLVFTLVNETFSRVAMYFGFSKSIGYHFYNVIELFLISTYFFNTIQPKRYKFFVVLTAFVYPLFAILNCFFLQPLKTLNSNYITFESFLVIGMSLYALYRILINDTIKSIINFPHFWLWTCILFCFSYTFFFWPCIRILYKQKSDYYDLVVCSQIIMHIVTYTGIGFVLFFYPKMVKNES